MTNDPSIHEQSLHYFLQEAGELLQALEQELLSLRKDYSLNKIHTMMRLTHTLKGAAAMVGMETIKSVAHSLEDIFKALCKPGLVIDAEVEALLFEGYECLRLPLTALFTGGQVNDAEVLDRTATVFAQLQEKLGDFFADEAYLPSSQELGFDLMQSIFKLGVAQQLDELAAVLADGDPMAIASKLRTEAEVFQGLAESLKLPGFGAIAQAAIAALAAHPEQVLTIAQTALLDFQDARVAVLNGDRNQGGQPSLALLQLSGLSTSVNPAVELEVSQDNFDVREPIVKKSTNKNRASRKSTQTPTSTNRQSRKTVQTQTGTNRQRKKKPRPENLPSSENASVEAQESATQREVGWVASTTDTNLNESQNQESANPLLETIWGAAEEIHRLNPSLEESEEVNDEVPPTPTPETDESSHVLHKDQIFPSRTVRVNVEELERLDYSIGELLTNQNRQSLQNDQLLAAVRVVLSRLKQHSSLLDQLQDRSDRLFTVPEQGEEDTGTFSASSTLGVTGSNETASLEASSPLSLPGLSIERFDSLELNSYSKSQILIQSILENTVQLAEAIDAIDLFARQSKQTVEKQRRLLTSTRDALMTARMSPLGELFRRFPLLLQQLQVIHKKSVVLEIRGNEVLVDKVVVEKLYDPLLHLIRNAFDHGIESPPIRQQRGKPHQGQIEICAYHQGRYLMIEIRDDGQGLDFDKIRATAVERQIVAEASNLNEAELTNLLFEPGFSTASGVNDLSGRGIGLNVVRTQLQAIQGSIAVSSELHRGTTFILQIPLSLNIARLLLTQAGDRIYTFFTDAIEQVLMPQAHQIRSWEGGKVLRWGKGDDEQLIPIYQLSKVLNYFSPLDSLVSQPKHTFIPQGEMMPIILIRYQDRLLGLEVEQMLGEQELVIRPLGQMIVPPSYIYGGSILADGRLTLVLDAAALMEYVLDRQASSHTNYLRDSDAINTRLYTNARILSSSSQQRQLPQFRTASLPPVKAKLVPQTIPNKIVLIVDDSITVRQSLAQALQKAGYQVLQAKDGYEAIQQLQHHTSIELVICDIEMPRMNGFEFLKHRQQDPALATIPVIILTSRSGEKHCLMASELGATAYITKPYLEHKLLTMVKNVLDRHLIANSTSG
ncbi:hybrid sensor histidine kinase/response regulator [Fischerella sp. PCC 9605]|uniref:hybrid sensor histidine kinase/response regulator n=1 Tax=Fischerella sp. PCC 9605 TaxID=1173024 RepID=UPI00047DEFAE|nr:hybrid sensor histidine kinase/response regulator [Fischerella sp. PCC 9605]